MPWPRSYEGRPLWGRAGYTALHGARLSSVPSGDQYANPASVPGHSSLQRAVLSVSSARKHSGAERLAALLGVSRAARAAVPCRSSTSGHRASSSKYTRGQSRETASLSRLFGSVVSTAKCVSMGHAHCKTRLSRRSDAAFQRGHSHAGGSQAGSGNGTRREHSPEEGGHRGGPSSRQRVQLLQLYFIVPGKGGCFLFRSKLSEPLSQTTEVKKALFKHASHTRSEDWWPRAI